jgi:uncharacterized protein (DUF2225 family)
MGIMENILGTKEQNETAQKNLDKQATEGSKLAKFLGGKPAETKPETKPETKTEHVKKAKGGSISSASKRADGCAIRGKTRA